LRPGYEWRTSRYNLFGESPHNLRHWHNQFIKWARDAQLRWLPPRPNFAFDEVWFGSSWWLLRGESVRAICAGLDQERLARDFRWSRCADEHFFQILDRRAGLEATSSHRFDDFPPGAASPRYLALEELLVARAQGLHFARKVTPEVAHLGQGHRYASLKRQVEVPA
jgi:hypothetical protein